MYTYDKATGEILRDGVAVGCKDDEGYVMVWYNKKLWRAHRLAFHLLGLELPAQVDHINGNRSDNRWANLRPCTNMQNQYNRKSCSKEGRLKGALYNKSKRVWYSMIRHGGRRTYLGTFPTEQAAHAAYMSAAKELHGEFASDGRAVAQGL